MAGGQRVVSGDHHTSVTGLVQHLDRGNSVRLHRTVENNESGKLQVALNRVSFNAVNVLVGIQVLVGQGQHSGSGTGERLERLLLFGALGLETSQTFKNKIFSGQSTSLVKTADVDSSSNRNSERLGTVDVELSKSSQRLIDGHGELHRKLRRNNRGDHNNTVENQLGLDSTHFCTFHPNVPGGNDGKHKQEQNEEKGLLVGDRHSLAGEDHDSDQRTLSGFESGLCNQSQSTVIWGQFNEGFLWWSHLQTGGTTVKTRVLVQSIWLVQIRIVSQLDRLFQQRSGFSRKHGLVDDTGAIQENKITRDRQVFVRSSGHRDNVARKKVVSGYLGPSLVSVAVDLVRLDSHTLEFSHGCLSLVNTGTFETDKHKEREQRQIPHLVHTPQGDGEELENKERSKSVLDEQFQKRWDWDVELVLAIQVPSWEQPNQRMDRQKRQCVDKRPFSSNKVLIVVVGVQVVVHRVDDQERKHIRLQEPRLRLEQLRRLDGVAVDQFLGHWGEIKNVEIFKIAKPGKNGGRNGTADKVCRC
ncbi:hypothetical protein OGAPHI_004702 [Ogataea philodendri]|uniref:Uncharacterized protein n=1 Tax=Ogataea philodendri TaxID=1378263 RepID=A0A9P8P1U5_9ASCO|nr:uncharacterized protein OGAPHI_004702 [Ogataea philodendri]KAH3663988.1 hypothetical protein OGAPHI_004702 [Ogataea philodendri]